MYTNVFSFGKIAQAQKHHQSETLSKSNSGLCRYLLIIFYIMSDIKSQPELETSEDLQQVVPDTDQLTAEEETAPLSTTTLRHRMEGVVREMIAHYSEILLTVRNPAELKKAIGSLIHIDEFMKTLQYALFANEKSGFVFVFSHLLSFDAQSLRDLSIDLMNGFADPEVAAKSRLLLIVVKDMPAIRLTEWADLLVELNNICFITHGEGIVTRPVFHIQSKDAYDKIKNLINATDLYRKALVTDDKLLTITVVTDQIIRLGGREG